jgi:hypothetical protein
MCNRLDKTDTGILETQLSNILHSADLKPVWAAVDVSDWNAETTSEFRQFFPKPYDLCFGNILQEIALWIRMEEIDIGPVGLIFGVRDEYKKRADLSFSAWKSTADTKDMFTTLTYAYPKHSQALQATDMLAYLSNLEWRRIQKEGLNEKNNWCRDPLLDKITARHRMSSGGMFDAGTLRATVKLYDQMRASLGVQPS